MLGFKRKVNKQPELPEEVTIDDVRIISRGNLKFKQVYFWRGNSRYSIVVKLETVIPSIGKSCAYSYLVLHSIN